MLTIGRYYPLLCRYHPHRQWRGCSLYRERDMELEPTRAATCTVAVVGTVPSQTGSFSSSMVLVTGSAVSLAYLQ